MVPDRDQKTAHVPLRRHSTGLPATASAGTNDLLGSIIGAAPVALVVVAPDGTIALANEEAERLFGYPTGELIGRLVELLVPPQARTRHAQDRSRFLANPQTRSMGGSGELFAQRKDGSRIPVEIALKAMQRAVRHGRRRRPYRAQVSGAPVRNGDRGRADRNAHARCKRTRSAGGLRSPPHSPRVSCSSCSSCTNVNRGLAAGKPQARYWPPLSENVAPVMKSASSRARNAIMRAMSIGLPSRPTGIAARIDFMTSSRTPATMSVST
jgi:PAS domain S-box-containing protein